MTDQPTAEQLDSDDVASDAEVLVLLEAFVRARLGPDTTIEGFSRVSTGRSRENWLFDALWNHDGKLVREPLIVRRDPLGGLLETNRADEFSVLRALERVAIPTPQARWLDASGDELGRPCLVMVRVDGTCDYYALNSGQPLENRIDLARRLCSLLADVHAVDWSAIGLGEHLCDPGPMASLVALAEWEAVLQRDQVEPYPELSLGAQWLRKNAPRSPRTVLVHADFKVGNVLLDSAGNIAALLDWELAHLGDPHEDLGWVTQPLRKKEHYVKGSWERDELLSHYEIASGFAVDPAAVEWWNVFAAYKTAVMQASGLRAYIEGRSTEHYQPSAPVLKAVLNAATGCSKTGRGSNGDSSAMDDVTFLRWDTAQTLDLLGQHSEVVGTDGVESIDSLVSANRTARQSLASLIATLTDKEDRSRQSEIGAHLLRRVDANPALARKPR